MKKYKSIYYSKSVTRTTGASVLQKITSRNFFMTVKNSNNIYDRNKTDEPGKNRFYNHNHFYNNDHAVHFSKFSDFR